MGVGFRKGTGGIHLNFKVVVSATEPTNPKENMVWINSDQKMTGWVCSHEQPTEVETGLVWIQTTTSLQSSVTINALKTKRKAINLYPLTAYQYDGSQWVEKTMKVCKNGSWGDMWTGLIYSGGTYYNNIPYVDVTSGASISDESNAIVVSWGNQEGVYRYGKRVFGPLDLTGFKKLTVTGSAVLNRGTNLSVTVLNAQQGGTELASGGESLGDYETATIEVDLTGINVKDELYIGVGHGGGATLGSSGRISYIKLSR